MAAITIVRADPAHLEAVLPLVAAYREFYNQRSAPSRERAFVAAHLRDRTSVVFLAAIDGVAVGFVQLFATASTVQLGTGYILEDLFVVPEARRGGVAGALIERALNHAHENGAVGMFLETASDNAPAQALYERLGWTREGRFLKYNAPL